MTSMALPESLVEKILAMVPFPYVFKARALSKSWNARFEPISSQDDAEKKLLATSFQKHVGLWSTNWKTFSPVFISKKDFVAYDRECQQWRKMPSLSFLPELCFANSYWRIGGSLLLVVGNPGNNVRNNWELFMANIWTRSWKKLPPPPHHSEHCFPPFLVTKLIRTKSTYKVVVFEDNLLGRNRSVCTAHIYDPNLNAWSSGEQISISFKDSGLSDWAYLNDVFYRVIRLGSDIDTRGVGSRVIRLGSDILTRGVERDTPLKCSLLAFNVNDGSFEILRVGHIFLRRPVDKDRVDLVVCNDSLLMLVYDRRHHAKGVIVLKIDLERRLLTELTRRAFSSDNLFQNPASDNKCIFFVGKVASGVLAYNIQEDEWSHFPCCTLEAQQWQVMELSSKKSRRLYCEQNWDRTGCCLDPFEAV